MSSRAYTAPPTVSRFMRSNAFIRLIGGPIGSGKSVGCAIEILRRCREQKVGRDGFRRSRWAVVRSTRPQLKSTTLKTWFDWIPPGVAGKWKESETTFFLEFGDVKAEIMFLPLDSPEDVQKVLSLELTGCWLNEAQFINREIFEGILGRLKRYPSQANGGSNFWGLIADTNMPEIDSYWYNVMEHIPIEEGNPNSVVQVEVFIQPDALGPHAENKENLEPTYYDSLAQGKSEDWIDTFIRANYSKSQSGKPVYQKQFRHDKHVAKAPLKIYQSLPVVVGHDFARNPAALFAQMHPDGRIKILREAVGSQVGIQTFIARQSKPIIRNDFGGIPGVFVGDPSGVTRNNTDENTCFKELEKEFPRKQGYRVRAAATNDPITRINALGELLSQYPDGDPLVEIDPSCRQFIEGLRSKYRYAKLRGFGEKYAEHPEKNHPWSDIVDAGQYLALFIGGKDYDPADYIRAQQDNSRRVIHRPVDSYTGY
jgi:hypothetical protein